MSPLCIIAPIGLHPRFVRVRPLRFRHEAVIRLRTIDREIATIWMRR